MEKLNCRFCNSEKKNQNSLRNHERYCKKNPDRRDMSGKNNPHYGKRGGNQYTKHGKKWVVKDSTRKKLSEAAKKQKITKETRDKISSSMKKAHEDGRAWNIGKSRWNNRPSWPEQFFMDVIENEFIDKKYIREFPVSIYSCDFAWPHKKKCIEIDGQQHQRFDEVIERDKRKNKVLKKEGWDLMRISWKDFYTDTKKWIKLSKEFIEE
jgi:very-short-patch-repair endonuclease